MVLGSSPRSLKQNEAIGEDLARHVGASSLDDLRRVSGDELLKAAEALTAPIDDQGFIWTQAVIDGRVLPEAPEVLLKDPAVRPMIVGSSAREIGLFGGHAVARGLDLGEPVVAVGLVGDRHRARRRVACLAGDGLEHLVGVVDVDVVGDVGDRTALGLE